MSSSLVSIREPTPEQLWKPGFNESVVQITIPILKKNVHRFAF